MSSDSQPIQKIIKIGKANVGLVHFDIALAKVLADTELDRAQAVDYLFDQVKKHNYVPATATDLYRQALGREYDRHTDGLTGQSGPLTLRILGPGCVSCNRIKEMLIDILQRLEIAADIEQIHELDEIWRHGVLTTPALVINGEVKSAGQVPTLSQLEQWIREVL